MFSNSNNTKWLILSILHYSILPLLYVVLLTTTSKPTFIIISIVAIIQTFLNYVDRGCFLMKLERKYVGKDWYGPYGLIPNITREMIQPIFILAMMTLGILTVYRAVKVFDLENKSI